MDIRFPIRYKIFLVILVPSLLLVFVIFLDWRHLGELGRSAEDILSKNYKSIQAAQQVRQGLEEMRNRVLLALFRHNPRPGGKTPLYYTGSGWCAGYLLSLPLPPGGIHHGRSLCPVGQAPSIDRVRFYV
ncbi:MAG: hypothetical protein JRF57_12500 [Deltaproteobacteria bacterium]|nr:hypothetical protein [Deltaproteobacteria bacterium]